jgi:para-nitrobenzyl esterase
MNPSLTLRLLCVAMALLWPQLYLKADQADGLTVQVQQGTLHGAGSDIRVFKGIPYASPPIGPLRWRPPQAAPQWTGVRDATETGASCLQPSNAKSSEDCLYLNVWTPAKQASERLPVMVWIHGGGFVAGSGSNMGGGGGERLARKDVVVVSLNYRLGVFGFLAHPELTAESSHNSSGNYGLLDQIAALRWVKQNVSAFGGNPKNVTVFGESAGATSIGYLLVSPLAKGLFQRAILESPSRVLLPDPELKTVVNGLTPMEQVGTAIGPHIAEMRRWSAAETMVRARAATDKLFGTGGTGKIGLRPESHVHMPDAIDRPWWAFVDGWVIPRQTQQAYSDGSEIVTPVLAGTNANEGSGFVRNFPPATEQQYRAYLRDIYRPCGDTMYALYPANSASEIKKAADQIITDALFLYGARGIDQAEHRREQKVFLYRFSRASRDQRVAAMGAWHGAEVPYVFGFARPNVSAQRFDAADQAISEAMMGAWVRFAATGDPNGGNLPKWDAWTEDRETYMDFGDSRTAGQLHDKLKFRVFEQVFSLSPAEVTGTCVVSAQNVQNGDTSRAR